MIANREIHELIAKMLVDNNLSIDINTVNEMVKGNKHFYKVGLLSETILKDCIDNLVQSRTEIK